MAAPRPEHAHATDRPATATLPPRPAHTTTGWRQDRRPVVSKRPLHNLAAAKMSPHIHIGPEPVLAAHARSLPAAGSRCPAGADSAPHSEQNFFSHSFGELWRRLIKPRTVLRNQCGRLSRVVTLTKVSWRVDEWRGRQLKRLAHRRGRCARSKIQ